MVGKSRALYRVAVGVVVLASLAIAIPDTAAAWQSQRNYKCMVRANSYAADSHPGISEAEAQRRSDWLYSQCAENRAADEIAEEHGSMAPELFPNGEKDRHGHPLTCMNLGNSRFGMHAEHNSANPPDDLYGPGGVAALNIPGEFMYAWIDGKARFLVRYVVWTIDDRDGNPVSPVRINQHPTYMGTPQVTVALVDFAEAYQPTSIWVEMPETIDVANRVDSGVLPGRSFGTRAWMESHCHDKRWPNSIPQILIDRVKDLGWLDGAATARSARAIRFVADGDPAKGSSWSLVEVPVTLPSQINTRAKYRWFYDSGVGYGDQTAPTRPLRLTAEPRTSTRVMLRWNPASDNVAVAGYKVYRNNVEVGYTSGLWFRDVQLDPLTEYRFKVFAVDTAGNVSPRSRIARATTLADELAPSRPMNVTVSVTSDSLIVNWDPAVDNDGVDYYVIKSSGVLLGRTTVTSWVMGGLDPATRYHVSVRAVDLSGNRGRKVHRWRTTAS